MGTIFLKSFLVQTIIPHIFKGLIGYKIPGSHFLMSSVDLEMKCCHQILMPFFFFLQGIWSFAWMPERFFCKEPVVLEYVLFLTFSYNLK